MTQRIRVGLNTNQPGGGEWLTLYRRADEGADYVLFATPRSWEKDPDKTAVEVAVPKAFLKAEILDET